jgi:hypothetical protein
MTEFEGYADYDQSSDQTDGDYSAAAASATDEYHDRGEHDGRDATLDLGVLADGIDHFRSYLSGVVEGTHEREHPPFPGEPSLSVGNEQTGMSATTAGEAQAGREAYDHREELKNALHGHDEITPEQHVDPELPRVVTPGVPPGD